MKKWILSAWIVLLFGFSPRAGTLYQLDFSNANGDPESWFERKGWKFKKDVDSMNLRFEGGKFIVEPDDDDLGLIGKEFNGKEELRDVKKLTIEWGVDQYPAGADWAGPKSKERNTREPISLMIFFGTEKQDSGSWAVPNLPYFISFFLGEKERPGQGYFGNYWKKGGRYFCIPCDGSVGKTFITEVDLPAKFRESFGKVAPPITGLTIEIDVQDTEKKNGRHSKAFIRKITLSN